MCAHRREDARSFGKRGGQQLARTALAQTLDAANDLFDAAWAEALDRAQAPIARGRLEILERADIELLLKEMDLRGA